MRAGGLHARGLVGDRSTDVVQQVGELVGFRKSAHGSSFCRLLGCIVNMVGLFTGKIRQNCGMLFHGNILAHQPILVDPQIRGKEMRDIGTGNGFATDVLAHMAFAELDIELFRSMNQSV